MISFNRHLATSVHVGKASTHPEKEQTNTNRYLHPRTHSISGKSTIKFSTGVLPILCARGGAFSPCLGLFLAQGYISLILPYAGQLGDIKCRARVVSRAIHPE
jgi:hypothetical protein